MKLTKTQMEALVSEVIGKLSEVDVVSIGPAKLKTEWSSIQNLDKAIKIKEREIEAAQEIVNKLEEEQQVLENQMRTDKKGLESKYDVRVKKCYVEDPDEDNYYLKVFPNLGADIHSRLMRQITLLSIDENIDGLTSDQLIDKMVQKNLKK